MFDLKQYKREVEFDAQDEIYVAKAPEIQGAIAHGDTDREALKNLEAVMIDCLEALAEYELEKLDGTSKFLLRMPGKLKAAVAKQANAVDTSINELLIEYIKRGLESYGKRTLESEKRMSARRSKITHVIKGERTTSRNRSTGAFMKSLSTPRATKKRA